ncbi:MAG: methylated-DNA--[protein]-cysteine S-methyltransferase [Minwuia sp.]|nr:methylated-DNA--[protein]-cysteine S-methyltransferase [Minwuia sp.]
MKNIPLSYTWLETPIGALLLAGDSASLHFLSFPGGHKAFGPHSAWHRSDAPFGEVKRQLLAYFAGELQAFDLPLTLHGTDFQKRVWGQLRTIPFGQTTTYGALAGRIGAPKSSRAVGAANGANPLPVIIPCHRVIGANGALTGFGGGIGTKQFLLELEGSLPLRSG